VNRITRMRSRAGGLAWAGAAEVAWHLLGPAWAFGLLAAALLWWLPAAIMPPMVTAADKAYAVEDRLNALVPKIPSPKAAPAAHSDNTSSPGDGSYSASNSSYGMGGGTVLSYNPGGSGNNGGASGSPTSNGTTGGGYTGGASNGGVTSGQIGGASQHYHDMSHAHGDNHAHDMTHYHTSSGTLQDVVNSTQGSHTALVSAVNSLKNSHSALVSDMQGLKSSHSDLSAKHNTLLTTLKNTKLLT
jgi:hypothetical protein